VGRAVFVELGLMVESGGQAMAAGGEQADDSGEVEDEFDHRRWRSIEGLHDAGQAIV